MISIVNVKEAKERIAKNNPSLIILDVRTPEEFEEEHLPKAVNINIIDHQFPEKIARLSKEKTYIIHCHSGRRAHRAAELMEESGFKHLSVVEGLIFGH